MSVTNIMREPARSARYRFGPYVIDLEASTLLENGKVLALQPKPFLLLMTLVRRHGEVVSREELANVLWPDTYVQVDQGLNAAMKKVRSILHDNAKSPRYIETLGSRGYRFTHPVEVLGWSGATPIIELSEPLSERSIGSSVHEQVVRARYQLSQHTHGSIRKAIDLFNQAVSVDPKHAPAYSGLANAYVLMGDMNLMVPQAAYQLAMERARVALDLDPTQVEAMVPMGWTTLLLNRDWSGAHSWLQRALGANPRHAPAFTAMGQLEVIRGRRDEALALSRHARLLAPLSTVNNVCLAQFLYFSSDFESAASQAHQTLEMNHGAQMMVLPVLCCSLLALGRTKEAIALLSAHLDAEDPLPALPALATALAHDGRVQEAQATINRSTRENENHPPSSYLLSFAYRALGNRGEAENWMIRAIHERSHLSLFLAVDPHAQDYSDFVGVKPWMEWLRHLAAS